MNKTLQMWRPALAGLTLFALVASVTLSGQQPGRKQPPPIGPAPSLKLPAIQKHKLSNGLAVWIVEHHEVPLAQINLIVRSGSAADPIGKYGVGSMTAAMLDEGAGTREALDLADAIEFLGANLSSTFIATGVPLAVGSTGVNYYWLGVAGTIFSDVVPIDETEGLSSTPGGAPIQ